MRKFAIFILIVIALTLIASVIVSCSEPRTMGEIKLEELPQNKYVIISSAKFAGGKITVGYFESNPRDTIYVVEGYNSSYPVSIHVK